MSDSSARSENLLPYALWTEEALRAVVQDALAHAAKDGLPGDHHFYLTFRTDQPGVAMPGHLRARYPQEMTIVLQHKFWDLSVDRGAGTFSVGLSFGGVPATLYVPFAAVTQFHDPAVEFALTFHADAGEAPADEHEEAENDAPEAEAAQQREDGSNVVSVDFTRKK